MTSTHALARTTDPDTSIAAAELQTTSKRAWLRSAIASILETYGPCTDEEIVNYVTKHWGNRPPSGIRSRRNEMALDGLVTQYRVDGAIVKRRGASGSPRIVWRLVEPGETPPDRPRRARRGAPALGDRTTPEHAEGLAAAQRMAAWHVGDAEAATFIINAYLDPAGANHMLDEMGAD